MVSDIDKGRAREKDVMDIYEAAGYLVWRPGKSQRRIKPGVFVSGPQDIFELFDIVAAKDDEPVHFPQVCSNGSDASVRRRKILDKIEYLPLEHMVPSVWLWVERKPWRVEQLRPIMVPGGGKDTHWKKRRIYKNGLKGKDKEAMSMLAWLRETSRSRLRSDHDKIEEG